MDQARGSATERGYDYGYQILARRVVRRYIATFGMVCPGWGIEAHEATKLTADHIRWPAVTEDDLQVLCPGCQNRKGAAR